MIAKFRRRRRPPAPARSSIYDSIPLGIDENAAPVEITLVYRNILLAGEPGAGKSGGLNQITAHAAMAPDCRLWLMDGKRVELGLWRPVADRFVGPDLADALDALADLQTCRPSWTSDTTCSTPPASARSRPATGTTRSCW